MAVPFQGGCHCGAVRYVCRAEPETTVFCHCLDCQRTTGGSFATVLYVQKSAVEIEGELHGYTVRADSGNLLTRKFCAACGSPVIEEDDGYPAHLFIKAGSLDDPGWLEPKIHIWTIRK